MNEYPEIRPRLLAMLDELNQRLARITADIRHLDQPLEQDFSEQAGETENNEVLDALGNSARAEAEQIKQALSRLDAGSYGICTACGEPIGAERLRALPYAALCMRCAEHRQD